MSSNRGGIGKRSRNNSNTNRPGRNEKNNSAPYKRTGLHMAVKVTGIIESDEKECVALLRLKAGIPVQISKSYWFEGALYLVFRGPKEASAIKKQSGLIVNGKKISIEFYKPNQTETKEEKFEIITKLTNLVTTRFDVNSKFLNLERLVDDPDFLSTNLKGFSHDQLGKKFGIALCKLIQDNCPGIVTLSLANNKITDTHFFSTLSKRIPDLQNISFKDNCIKNFDDLKPFHGDQFKNLRELILDGNPIREKELSKAGGFINFRSNIKTLFPTLKLLDGEELLDEIEFGIGGEVSRLPVTTKTGFSDSEVTLTTAQGFLAAFFEYFDGNRNQLANFYEHNSVFSLSICNNISASKMSRFDYDKLFKPWESHNRNLIRVKQPDKRFNGIHVGTDSIIKAFNKLPGTKHPLEEPPEKKKFIFDSYQQGTGSEVFLYIYLHGEFSIVGTNSKRSFDRTFILVPAAPGSRAALAGLPVSIVNDSMVLRTFRNNEAWRTATDLQPDVPAPAVVAVAPSAPQLELLKQLQLQHSLVFMVNKVDQQLEMIARFSQVTGLNYPFSLQCLQETGWSEQQATEVFNNVKHQVPPEAFQM